MLNLMSDPDPQFDHTESGNWTWTWWVREGIGDPPIRHEFELECKVNDDHRWMQRSSYGRAGWSDPLDVSYHPEANPNGIPEPINEKDADQLVRIYATTPRGERPDFGDRA